MTSTELEVQFMEGVKLPEDFDIYSYTPLEKMMSFPNPKRGQKHERSYRINSMVCVVNVLGFHSEIFGNGVNKKTTTLKERKNMPICIRISKQNVHLTDLSINCYF